MCVEGSQQYIKIAPLSDNPVLGHSLSMIPNEMHIVSDVGASDSRLARARCILYVILNTFQGMMQQP